jgi:hypothetical protein
VVGRAGRSSFEFFCPQKKSSVESTSANILHNSHAKTPVRNQKTFNFDKIEESSTSRFIPPPETPAQTDKND